MSPHRRTFTVLDGAVGRIVYRLLASSLDDLRHQLVAAVRLSPPCARAVALNAWGGSVVGFETAPLVVVPGDHPAVFVDLDELPPAFLSAEVAR